MTATVKVRSFGVAAMSLVVVLAAAGAARAQDSLTGRIVGNVVDSSGQPLKGVKIVTRSDTQIGGAKTAYSNDEGTFRFPALQPGRFEIVASAPKMATVVQKGIQVGINAAADVDIVMEVESKVEEVKVVEKAPVVRTTSAVVREDFDAEFVANLPVESRTNVEGFVGNNAPGATYTSNRSFRVRGANVRQSVYTLDGFNSNTMPLAVKSLAAMEIQTAGYGADYAGIPGGVANMVTKSGSNKYEVDIAAHYEDTALRFFKQPGEADLVSRNLQVSPTFSGPILRDRLWFYLDSEFNADIRDRPQDVTGTLPRGKQLYNRSVRPTLKLTWQVTPRNKIQSLSVFNRVWITNNNNPATFTEEAQRNHEFHESFNGLIWESVLSDSLFFKSQIGYTRMQSDRRPQSCLSDPIDCDNIPAYRQTFPFTYTYNNNDFHEVQLDQTVQFINTLEWFASSRRFGEHSLKLKSDLVTKIADFGKSTPGDAIIQFNGTASDRRTDFYANDPRFETPRYGWRFSRRRATVMTNSLQDSVKPTRFLTIHPGVGLVTSRSSIDGENQSLAFDGVTPHLAVIWDPTHDGRTALRASFNQYVDADVDRRDATGIGNFIAGAPVQRECRWNDVSQAFDTGCVYSGGSSRRTVGLPCGTTGLAADGSDCKQKLKLPRTWEYMLGAEREVSPGIAVGGDAVYRFYDTPFEDRETNRIWNGAGTALEPTGSFRNGRNEVVTDLATPDELKKQYVGVTGSVRKREGAFRVQASYTWARMWGNGDNLENGAWGTVPANDRFLYGNLPDDIRHQIRSSVVYQMTSWLSTGFIYRYNSGRPYNRFFRNDVTGGFIDLRAPVGVNPGVNINDPADDRDLRLPDQHEMNLQVRARLKPLTGQNVDLWADIINLLALRTPTAQQTQDGPVFGTVTGIKDPFRMRLGVRYRY